MYKLEKNLNQQIAWVRRLSDMACIPFDSANTDYQQFKKDIMAGGELKDADGVVMTDAQEFVRGLP